MSSAIDAEFDVYSVSRLGGLSTDIGELTLQFIGEDLSAGDNPDSDINSDLRDLPIDQIRDAGGDPTNVSILVEFIIDDTWGSAAIGGAICTENDGDHLACENTGLNPEEKVDFCTGEFPAFTEEPVDLTAINAVVVFVNGPSGQVGDCFQTDAPTATWAGVVDPAGEARVVFDWR